VSTGREGGERREGRDGRDGFRWIFDPESRIQDPDPGFFAPASRVKDPDPGACFCCWTLPSSHLAICFILAAATIFTPLHFFLPISLFLIVNRASLVSLLFTLFPNFPPHFLTWNVSKWQKPQILSLFRPALHCSFAQIKPHTMHQSSNNA